MRKIVSLMHMSLDGFVADTEGSLSWVSLPPDMYKEVMQSIHKVDTAIYGRVVYYMMKNYWPTLLEKENVDEVSLDHAKWVQDVKKIVFSKISCNLASQAISWDLKLVKVILYLFIQVKGNKNNKQYVRKGNILKCNKTQKREKYVKKEK